MTKKKKSLLAIMLIVTLIFPMILPGYGKRVYGENKNLDKIFTDVSLKINGNDINIDQDVDINFNNNDTVVLLYDWTILDEVELKAGDYANMHVPIIFRPENYPLEGDVVFGGESVGRYLLTSDNNFNVVFNDKLEDKEDRQGSFGLTLKFNESKIKENIFQEVKFEGSVEKKFNITFKSGLDDYTMSKQGNSDKTENATKIDWLIDANFNLGKLGNGIIEDTIPQGLSLIEDSIEVYELTIGLDDDYNPVVKGENRINPSISLTDESFKITLGETNKGYRIKYSTDIIEYKSPYINNATLKDGTDVKKTADATVTTTLGSMVEKDGSLIENNTKIKWTININKGLQNLTNVLFEDTLDVVNGSKHKVLEGTIKVYELNQVGSSWNVGDEIASGISINADETNFTINFDNLNKRAYHIEYESETDFDTYEKNYNFINRASLKKGETIYGNADKEIGLWNGELLTKYGEEQTAYGDQIISWKVVLNEAKHNIINANIKDTIPQGLELIDGSVEIKKDYIPMSLPSDYAYSENTLELNLGTTSSRYEIVYKTKVTDPSQSPFTNNVTLKGDGLKGEGIINNQISKGQVISIKANNDYIKAHVYNETINGTSYNGIDYINKTFSWKLTFDEKYIDITSLQITDTFEVDKSMVFLKESLIVKKGNTTLLEETDYTISDNKSQGFILTFKPSALAGRDINSNYNIYYKTSFDPDLIISEGGQVYSGTDYKNNAKFTVTTRDINAAEETVNIEKDAAYSIDQVVSDTGKKSGSLNRDDREITWKVYVNLKSQDLKAGPYIITDTYSEGQSFKTGSLKVKDVTLNEYNGQIEEGEESSILYTLGEDEQNKSFTLTFNGGIDKAYLIEYVTNINGLSKENYSNEALVTGKSEPYKDTVNYQDYNNFIKKDAPYISGNNVYEDDEIEWEVELNKSLSEMENIVFTDEINGPHVYLEGSVNILVYDGANWVDISSLSDDEYNGITSSIVDNQLSVQFTSMTKYYKITYKTVVTGNTGTITNTAKINGIELAQGTSDPSSNKTFSVSQSSWGTGSGVNKGWLKLEKQDSEDISIKLEGAKFELSYILNGEKKIVASTVADPYFYTNEQGILEIKGLSRNRIYTLEEIEAPQGYKLDDNSINNFYEFQVESNIETKLEITNEKRGADPSPTVTPQPSPEITPQPSPELTPQPSPEITPQPSPELTPQPSPEITPQPSPEITPQPSPELTPQPSPELTPHPSPELTPHPSPELTPHPSPELTPQPTPQSTTDSTSNTEKAKPEDIPKMGEDNSNLLLISIILGLISIGVIAIKIKKKEYLDI